MFREPNDGAVFVPNFLCAPRRRLLQTWLKHTLQSESYGILVKWILKKVFLLEDKTIFRHRPRAKRLVPDPGVGRNGDPKPRNKGQEESKKRSVLCLSQLAETSSDMLYALFPRDPAYREQRWTKPREIRNLLKSTVVAIDWVNQKYFFRNVTHMHHFSSSHFHVSRQSRGLVVVYMN